MSRFTNGFVQNYLNNLDPPTGASGSASGPAGGDLIGNYPNPFLISSGVISGTYGSSVLVPQFSVDSKGRITSVSEISIAFPPPNVVMDDGPVVIGAKYPTQPSVEGCWYGFNTKQFCVADAVVLGNNCRGAFSGAVAVGKNCEANSAGAISVGENLVNGIQSAAVGLFNLPVGDECYLFGTLNTANSQGNYAFGSRNTVTGQQGSTAVGFLNNLSGGGYLQAHGYQNTVTGANYANAFGYQNTVTDSGTAVGFNCQSTGGFCAGYFGMADILSVAIGFKVNTLGSLVGSPIVACVGIGSNLTIAGQYNVVLGSGCVTESDQNVVMGNACEQRVGTKNVLIGDTCGSTGSSNVVIGDLAQTSVSESLCFGKNAAVVATDHALSFGLNAASVTNASMNFRLNNTDRQIEAFTKLYQTFVTAGGDTALSYFGSNSGKSSYFTGALTENVILPQATAGVIGYEVVLVNKSTGVLSIWADAAKTSLVGSLAYQQWGFFTIIDISADVAASWSFQVGSGPIVMDNTASGSQFATAPQSEGCWYGTGSKIACGANGVCIGNGVGGGGNTSPESITIGYQANANSPGGSAPSIAIGVRATCGGGNNFDESNICIGYESSCFGYPTTGASTIAFGRQAQAFYSGMAFGNLSYAFFDSIAFGIGARCENNSSQSIALGGGAFVQNVNNALAIGAGAVVTSSFNALSIAVNANTVGTFFTNLLLNNNARQIETYSSLYRTVVTSAGVENISFSDAKKIYFTGTTTHDIVLPNATAGVVGFEVKIVNNSTGALTIWADFTGGSLVTILPGKNPGVTRGGWGFFNLIDTAAQVAASWSAELGTTMI